MLRFGSASEQSRKSVVRSVKSLLESRTSRSRCYSGINSNKASELQFSPSAARSVGVRGPHLRRRSRLQRRHGLKATATGGSVLSALATSGGSSAFSSRHGRSRRAIGSVSEHVQQAYG